MTRATLQRWAGQRGLAAALLVAALLLPLFLDPLSGVIDDMTIALAYAAMALGLNIVVGYAGLLDLGYVAFFALGAYAAGWLASPYFATVRGGKGIHVWAGDMLASAPGIHLNFLLVIVAAVAICALAGILIGLPTLRLRGDYVAIVTLAFGEIIGRLAVNGPQIHLGAGAALTNGRQGITPVDPVDLPGLAPFDGSMSLRPWYWTALALVVVALVVNLQLRGSRLGRAWVAVREDEDVAASMGIPLVRTKLLAYATGAALGGMSGAFLGSYLNTVNADQFQASFSIFVFAMLVLGGLGSVWGAVLGAVVLSFVNSTLIPDVLNGLPHKLGLNMDLTQVSFGIFGALILIMTLVRPAGLIPAERNRRTHVDPDDPSAAIP
jgi:branched-chain amino acid transport system permease protein